MFRKIILLIISFLFYVSFSVFFLVFNLKYFFLQADFYKTLLVQTHFYERILSEAPQIIVDNIDVEDIDLPVEIDEEDIFLIIDEVITPSYLQAQVEGILDEVFGYFVEGKDSVEIKISLLEVKEKIESVGLIILEEKLNELPICTPEQLLDFVINQDNDKVTCRPSLLSSEILVEHVSFVDQIPDSLILTSPETAGYKQFVEGTENLRDGISIILTRVYPISLALSLLCLFLLYWMAHPMSSRFRLLGINLLNVIMLPLGVSITGLLFGDRFVSTMMNSFGGEITQETITSLASLGQELSRVVWTLLLQECLVVFSASFVLLIIARVYSKQEQQEIETHLIEQVQQVHKK